MKNDQKAERLAKAEADKQQSAEDKKLAAKAKAKAKRDAKKLAKAKAHEASLDEDAEWDAAIEEVAAALELEEKSKLLAAAVSLPEPRVEMDDSLVKRLFHTPPRTRRVRLSPMCLKRKRVDADEFASEGEKENHLAVELPGPLVLPPVAMPKKKVGRPRGSKSKKAKTPAGDAEPQAPAGNPSSTSRAIVDDAAGAAEAPFQVPEAPAMSQVPEEPARPKRRSNPDTILRAPVVDSEIQRQVTNMLGGIRTATFAEVKKHLTANRASFFHIQITSYWTRSAVGLKLMSKPEKPQICYISFRSATPDWNFAMVAAYATAHALVSGHFGKLYTMCWLYRVCYLHRHAYFCR